MVAAPVLSLPEPSVVPVVAVVDVVAVAPEAETPPVSLAEAPLG